MDDQTILQQIDACRSGDAFDPSLASLSQSLEGDERVRGLYERVQRADAAITDAMQDVPVPADLAQRLLASLQIAKLGEPVDLDATEPATALERVDWLESDDAKRDESADANEHRQTAEKNTDRRTVLQRSRRPFPLRRVVAAATVLTACVMAWALYNPGPELVTLDQIDMEFRRAYETEVLGVDPSQWTTAAMPHPDFAVSPFIHSKYRTLIRWRRTEVGGHMAIIHDLWNEPGKRGTLFVIQRKVTGLDVRPPEFPSDTQGRCVGVWQSDEFVFALVVQGDFSEYTGALDELAGAIAQLRRDLRRYREASSL